MALIRNAALEAIVHESTREDGEELLKVESNIHELLADIDIFMERHGVNNGEKYSGTLISDDQCNIMYSIICRTKKILEVL